MPLLSILDLKEHISTLESEVDKLSQGKSTLASAVEENAALQMRTEVSHDCCSESYKGIAK